LKCTDRLSSETHHIYSEIRKVFPKFIEDKPKYKDLEKIRKYFEKSDPVISFKSGSVPAEVSPSNGLEKIKSK